MIMLCIEMCQRVRGEQKKFGWAVLPIAVRRNGSECAAGCTISLYSKYKEWCTKGFIQVGNSAESCPLATAGGPLANIQRRT